MSSFDLITSARRTVSMERDAMSALINRIDSSFEKAGELLLACRGRVVVTGMGKSGHVGRKIAATLASTGTPAFFVHPGEASHGDIGMITNRDVVIALSNSGNTAEVLTIVPLIKRMNARLIAMTGNADSQLATLADVNLDVSVEVEACPLDLTPTSSTTVTLVMGDALAIALLESRGFTAEDFAFSHPGGALGRKLLLRVQDLMHQGREIPAVPKTMMIRGALLEMTQKGFGMTTVVDEAGHLLGVFTDGDLRRTLDDDMDFRVTAVGEHMSRDPRTITGGILAAEALRIMEDNKISALVIVDDEQRPTGILHLHDLLRAEIA